MWEGREGYLEMKKTRKIISSLSYWMCSLQFHFSLFYLPLEGILFLFVFSCELLLVLGMMMIFVLYSSLLVYLLLIVLYLSQCILHNLQLFIHAHRFRCSTTHPLPLTSFHCFLLPFFFIIPLSLFFSNYLHQKSRL